ncbi:dhhc zinc finger domain containing protein [Stylonychia lemnae]|uniref:Dhhc zinc finger domain containing protein n=1 Tax=Stylonychia lemnae TaxID=5949 RepID=A0A078B2F2_STYLE|nr:dhhc zinc finger domain containing protein [Stylonychia lemnae]|eukprot:CDW88669.1 dhhc zinc finger domain containing protein [Stylonychia lemnae]
MHIDEIELSTNHNNFQSNQHTMSLEEDQHDLNYLKRASNQNNCEYNLEENDIYFDINPVQHQSNASIQDMSIDENDMSQEGIYFFSQEKNEDVIDWKNIDHCIQNADDKSMRMYFDYKKVRIITLFDERGYSLLHLAVYHGNVDKVKQLLRYAIDIQKETEDNIKQWVNSKTYRDKFTPLHFASYKGNIEMIQVLLDYKSSPTQINNFGLNMLHVAAQGDAASSLYIFKELNLNINQQDFRGSTALHWACYQQSEVALSYLLAWNPNLNIQDVEGHTPLHLAVRSVQMTYSTRSVRFLLLKGAQVNIKDKKGKLAIDYVKDVKSSEMQIELYRMLRPQSRIRCLMFKAPVRPSSKNYITLIIYFILFFYTQFLLFTYVFLRITKLMTFANIFISILTLIFYMISFLNEPGYIFNKKISFRALLEQFDATQLCPELLIYIQVTNFLRGKTTNERFSKQTMDQEDFQKQNSQGIKQIPSGQQSADQKIAEDNLSSNLLVNSDDPVSKFREMQQTQINERLSFRRIKQNCLQMCCSVQMISQEEIYMTSMKGKFFRRNLLQISITALIPLQYIYTRRNEIRKSHESLKFYYIKETSVRVFLGLMIGWGAAAFVYGLRPDVVDQQKLSKKGDELDDTSLEYSVNVKKNLQQKSYLPGRIKD